MLIPDLAFGLFIAVVLDIFAILVFEQLFNGSETYHLAEYVHVAKETDVAYHIARHGMGVTLISDTLVLQNSPDTQIHYYKIDGPHAQRDNYFYCKCNKYMTKAMREFLNVAKQK